MLISAELKECVTWFIYFLNVFWPRYNCANFYHCKTCVTDFRKGEGFFVPLIREQIRKSPFWIELNHKEVQIMHRTSLYIARCVKSLALTFGERLWIWNWRGNHFKRHLIEIRNSKEFQIHWHKLSKALLVQIIWIRGLWYLFYKFNHPSDFAIWWLLDSRREITYNQKQD